MDYKDTAEYAFDMLEFKYNKVKNFIDMIGTQNVYVAVPQKFRVNLQALDKDYINNTIRILLPTSFHGIKIVYTMDVDKPLFILKG